MTVKNASHITRNLNSYNKQVPMYSTHLQQTINNQATPFFIHSDIPFSFYNISINNIQAKLKISNPNDPYEEEADRIAEQVMSMPESTASSTDEKVKRKCKRCEEEEKIERKTSILPEFMSMQEETLQRKCACGGSSSMAGECEECRKKKVLQRRSINQTEPLEVPFIVDEVLRSPGQPLDTDTRVLMEPRFGYDFSAVRVHTDTKASESALAVNALAYTIEHDIVFGSGQYAPNTNEGRRLLAHELTHVVQQSYGSSKQRQTIILARKPAVEEPYIPGEMSRRYSGLSPEERARVNEEVDRIFREETGVTRKLDWNKPEDRPLARKWLRIRDEVMAKHTAGPVAPAGPTPMPTCGTAPSCPIGGTAPELRDPHIPSGSQCRGACGPDCPSTCTPQPDVKLSIPDSTGQCHFLCTYTRVIECGSHQGCRDHDDCYDRCAASGASGLCWRGCDYDCIRTHGIRNCNSWRTGGGPFDRMLIFSDPPTQTGPFPGP